MQLPFSQIQFLDVFGAYNTVLWPAALVLWLVSAGMVLTAARTSAPPHRALSALLAVHWAWSALAYHAAFFTRINPAAWIFAGLFLLQAALFVWLGVLRGRLRFWTGRSMRHKVAGALVVYALAYPLLSFAEGFAFPRLPTFGVPCPTTILTIGLLLTVHRPPRVVALIPIAWSIIGGSAAFLLGVPADLGLFLAAAFLIAAIRI